MNTNQESFRDEISQIASSIKKEFGIKVNNVSIMVAFCNLFEKKIRHRISKI